MYLSISFDELHVYKLLPYSDYFSDLQLQESWSFLHSLSHGYALLFSGLKSNCFLLHQSQMSQLEVFSSGHPQHLAYDMHFSLSLYLDNYFFPQHIQMSGWQASYAPGVSAPPVQGQGFHASVFSAPRTVSDTLKELPRCVLNGLFKINNQGCFHEQM